MEEQQIEETQDEHDGLQPLDELTPKAEGRIPALVIAIKTFLAIGMALGPLIVCASFTAGAINTTTLVVCLVLYALAIPIGAITWWKLNRAKSKREMIVWGILSLILVNTIAGILILAAWEGIFPLAREDGGKN